MKSKNKKVKLNKKIMLIIIIAIVLIIGIILASVIIKGLTKEKVAGNFNNMGLAVKENGVTYYNKYEQGIVKVKGGKEYQITDETAYSMNVVGDTIYYLTVSNTNTIDIKSVSTNGDGLKKIKTISTIISKIYVEDGFIYYATNRDVSGIAKINIETGEENVITPTNVQDYVVTDGNVYFTDNVNDLYSIKTSGQNLHKIETDGDIKKIQVLGKWIYFYDEKENALCRIKKDGTSKKVVSNFVNNELYNVTNKKIYYYDSVAKQICSTKIKGKKSKAIVTLQATKTRINIAGDVIYYLDASKDEGQIYQMYRIRQNGKEEKLIEY